MIYQDFWKTQKNEKNSFKIALFSIFYIFFDDSQKMKKNAILLVYLYFLSFSKIRPILALQNQQNIMTSTFWNCRVGETLPVFHENRIRLMRPRLKVEFCWVLSLLRVCKSLILDKLSRVKLAQLKQIRVFWQKHECHSFVCSSRSGDCDGRFFFRCNWSNRQKYYIAICTNCQLTLAVR